MLKKFNGEIPNNSLPSGSWFNTKEAADKLHIHFHTLQRLRKDGLLQPRLHYIQVTNTKTSPILWNIDQIMLRMGDFQLEENSKEALKNKISRACHPIFLFVCLLRLYLSNT